MNLLIKYPKRRTDSLQVLSLHFLANDKLHIHSHLCIGKETKKKSSDDDELCIRVESLNTKIHFFICRIHTGLGCIRNHEVCIHKANQVKQISPIQQYLFIIFPDYLTLLLKTTYKSTDSCNDTIFFFTGHDIMGCLTWFLPCLCCVCFGQEFNMDMTSLMASPCFLDYIQSILLIT